MSTPSSSTSASSTSATSTSATSTTSAAPASPQAPAAPTPSPDELRAYNDTLRGAGPHRSRPIRFVRPERIGDWRLKLYTIATHGQLARPALVDEALRRAPAIFPHPALGDERHGVGFIIVHDAATASIVLYYWWQSFNELHQRIHVGPKDNPAAMTQMANQSAGCVWELEIVNFERQAWLGDVLANPSGPDIAGYLGRHHDAEI